MDNIRISVLTLHFRLKIVVGGLCVSNKTKVNTIYNQK